MNDIKFGTGGWRARIGEEFTQENVERVARAIAVMVVREGKTGKPIVIGYDNRFLSEEAAVWVAEVLNSFGIKIIYINTPVPTPLVMHYVKHHNLYYGIEITASHNPYNYNGIKLFVEEGRDAPVEITQKVEDWIKKNPTMMLKLSFAEGIKSGSIEVISNPWADFVRSILLPLDIGKVRSKGFSVLVDPMHGSGLVPLQMVLNSLWCQVDVINGNKDAYFGGRVPAPSEETLKELSLKVVEGGYDLGIALDGDGDRLGIIDPTGRHIDANEILCLLYVYLLAFKGWKGPVVRNYATTHRLDKIAEFFKEDVYEVPIGFKHVSAAMDEHNAVLGGESSGGLTVRGHIHGKDSIYAAALFVEMVAVTGLSPVEMLDVLKHSYAETAMVEENIQLVDEEQKKNLEQKIKLDCLPLFDNVIERVDDTDGRKIYFQDDSWVICRMSGTEPVLRIFAEAATAEKAKRHIENYRKFLGI